MLKKIASLLITSAFLFTAPIYAFNGAICGTDAYRCCFSKNWGPTQKHGAALFVNQKAYGHGCHGADTKAKLSGSCTKNSEVFGSTFINNRELTVKQDCMKNGQGDSPIFVSNID